MKEIGRNLVQLCFGVLLALLVIEFVFLRWFSPQLALQLKGLYSEDPQLGWRLTPGFEGQYRSSEFDIELRVNSDGLRDVERSVQLGQGDSDSYTVLAIGDSFFFGSWSDYDDSVLTILERSIQTSHPDFVIHKAGVPAYGTDQQADFLEMAGAKYQPDLVLAGVFVGNDFVDTLVGPALYHFEDGLLVWNKAVMAEWWPYNTRTGERTNPINWPESSNDSFARTIAREMQNWARNNLHIYHFVLGIKQGVAASDAEADDANAETGDIETEQLPAKRESFWPAPEADLTVFDYETFYLRNYTPVVESAVDAMLRQLEQIKATSDALNAELLVVLIPTKEQVYPALWHERLALFDLSEADVELDKPQRILHDWAQSQNVQLLDLLSGFVEEGQRGNALYFDIDKHWNDSGHRLAASLMQPVVEQLVERPVEEQ